MVIASRLGIDNEAYALDIVATLLANIKAVFELGLSPILSSVVAISEVGSGMLLIVSGFIKGPIGNLLTRLSAFTITIIMINVFAIGHPDWFFTTKLFTSEQIFLFLISLYFVIKGNN